MEDEQRTWAAHGRLLPSAWAAASAGTTATACATAATTALAWSGSLSWLVLGRVLDEQGVKVQCVWKEEIPAEFHFGGQGLDYYFFA